MVGIGTGVPPANAAQAMNRIELIALFTSLQRFLEKKDYESIEIIVDKILKEAERNKD